MERKQKTARKRKEHSEEGEERETKQVKLNVSPSTTPLLNDTTQTSIHSSPLLSLPVDILTTIISYTQRPRTLRQVHSSLKKCVKMPSSILLHSTYVRPKSNWLSSASMFDRPEYEISNPVARDVHWLKRGHHFIPADFGRPKAYTYDTLQLINSDKTELAEIDIPHKLPDKLHKDEIVGFRVTEFQEHHVCMKIKLFKIDFYLNIEAMVAHLKDKQTYQLHKYFADILVKRLTAAKEHYAWMDDELSQLISERESNSTTFTFVWDVPLFGAYFNMKDKCFKLTHEIAPLQLEPFKGALLEIDAKSRDTALLAFGRSNDKLTLVISAANQISELQTEFTENKIDVIHFKNHTQANKFKDQKTTNGLVLVSSALIKKIHNESAIANIAWDRVVFADVAHIIKDQILLERCSVLLKVAAKWGIQPDDNYTKYRKQKSKAPEKERILQLLCPADAWKQIEPDQTLKDLIYKNLKVKLLV